MECRVMGGGLGRVHLRAACDGPEGRPIATPWKGVLPVIRWIALLRLEEGGEVGVGGGVAEEWVGGEAAPDG